MKYLVYANVSARRQWQVPAITNLDNAPTQEEAKLQTAIFDDLMVETTESGELRVNYPFRSPEQTQTAQVRDGRPAITFGPFGEATEQASGLFLYDIQTPERLVEILRRYPSARNGTVIARPVQGDAAEVLDLAHTPDAGLRYLVWAMPGATVDPGTAGHAGPGLDEVVAQTMQSGELRAEYVLLGPEATVAVQIRNGEVAVMPGPLGEATEPATVLYVFDVGSQERIREIMLRLPAAATGVVVSRPVDKRTLGQIMAMAREQVGITRDEARELARAQS